MASYSPPDDVIIRIFQVFTDLVSIGCALTLLIESPTHHPSSPIHLHHIINPHTNKTSHIYNRFLKFVHIYLSLLICLLLCFVRILSSYFHTPHLITNTITHFTLHDTTSDNSTFSKCTASNPGKTQN